MSEPTTGQTTAPLSPRTVELRNTCLGALSRRTSHRPPTPVELAKIRDDLRLKEAWLWWSKIDTPTEAVAAIRFPVRRPRRRWPARVVALLATGAWLLIQPGTLS